MALEGENRILMPNLPLLQGLRHCWCWEARPRPYLPTWSFAKVPRLQFSPEENVRLLSIYMRPWTLDESESRSHTPLLSLLGQCKEAEENVEPVLKTLPASGSAHEGTDPEGACPSGASPRPTKRRLTQKARIPFKYFLTSPVIVNTNNNSNSRPKEPASGCLPGGRPYWAS